MNYFTAKQRLSDMLWDYTMNNIPIGYCQKYIDPDSYNENIRKFMSKSEVQRIRLFKEKYHTHGHPTKEEACNCYKEYILDHALSLNRKDESCQRKCQKCKQWTNLIAGVGAYNIWFLCEQHQTREIVSELYEVWESWES